MQRFVIKPDLTMMQLRVTRARNRAQGGCLSGPVPPKQGNDFTLGNSEADILNDIALAIIGFQPPTGEIGRRCAMVLDRIFRFLGVSPAGVMVSVLINALPKRLPGPADRLLCPLACPPQSRSLRHYGDRAGKRENHMHVMVTIFIPRSPIFLSRSIVLFVSALLYRLSSSSRKASGHTGHLASSTSLVATGQTAGNHFPFLKSPTSEAALQPAPGHPKDDQPGSRHPA